VRVYYVYMLRCFDGTFYTGITNDIDRRFAEHGAGHDPDSYTHSRRPLRLVYVGEFQQPAEAIAFEKRLKGWSHRKKRAFAERDWPALQRFSDATAGRVSRKQTSSFT
jgi:putative endonuclease